MPEADFRRLPSVEILSGHPAFARAIAKYTKPIVLQVIRAVIETARAGIAAGKDAPSDQQLVNEILNRIPEQAGEYLREVINGTGVLIHTNLGRSPFPRAGAPPEGYSNLEYELQTGKRGKRGRLADTMVAQLAGAEAALIVNNNAAAVYLVLSGLAHAKEVIISRGELVQIGGGFRIPEILERSGAKLREVGTTNKTTIEDYVSAMNEQTALILKVHHSNFKMSGFVAEVSLSQLTGAIKGRGVPVVMDLGSGAVSDLQQYGLPHEPTLGDAIHEGAELVTASGDKLFGGPQAGMVAGKREYVEILRQDPFYRALRPDKTTLAGMEYAARAHLEGAAMERLPLYQMLAHGLDKMRQRAEAIMKPLHEKNLQCRVSYMKSTVGGGSLPQELFESIGLEITPECRLEQFAKLLRDDSPPVIGTIGDGVFRIDLRTVFPGQDEILTAALLRAHERSK